MLNFEIYNFLGQLIDYGDIISNLTKLNFNYPKGNYIVKIKMESGVSISKIISFF